MMAVGGRNNIRPDPNHEDCHAEEHCFQPMIASQFDCMPGEYEQNNQQDDVPERILDGWIQRNIFLNREKRKAANGTT